MYNSEKPEKRQKDIAKGMRERRRNIVE